MIKIEHTEVLGWEHAIRGMRNPMNSWEKSDSKLLLGRKNIYSNPEFDLGEKDFDLMLKLSKSGTDHAKFRRMITVYVDLTAPLYWWKEFDTYKIGTVANSCSTMHKIAEKEFILDDFSYEHLYQSPRRGKNILEELIEDLNFFRKEYLETKNKQDWWQMIQLLPSSYNQKRTVMLNYEVLANIYKSRKDHKLDEWREFCKWIENLPYSEIITAVMKEANQNG